MKFKIFLIQITILLIIIMSIGVFYSVYSKNNNKNINIIEEKQKGDNKEVEESKEKITEESKIESFEDSNIENNDKISDISNVEITEEAFNENTTIQNDETPIINLTSDSTSTQISTPISTTSLESTPTCTPKKFDFPFIRADFESMEVCQSKGNQYMEYGYGYICDYFLDSCGTYYYMLTLFDTNGTHYDYHNVEIPE